MPDEVLFVAIVIATAAAGMGIVVLVARRTGTAAKLTPRDWRIVVLGVGGMLIPAAIGGWLIGTGHAGAGLVILIAFFVLPSMATTWIRVATSRTRAAEARTKRRRSSG